MTRRSLSFLILAAGFGLFLLAVYAGINRFYTPELPNTPKSLADYGSSAGQLPDSEDILARTDILELAVYGSGGKPLGTSFDAYIAPESGEIRWLSVNVAAAGAERQADLVLVPASVIRSFDDENLITLTVSEPELREFPYHQRYDERVVDLVSLRNLPKAPIYNATGKKIGEVLATNHSEGTITQIIFEARRQEALNLGQTEGIFSLPFDMLGFTGVQGDYGHWTEIRLTERQSGAVQMYLENVSQ